MRFWNCFFRSKELEAGGGAAALQGVGIQAVVTECLICYCDIIFSDKMPDYNCQDSVSELTLACECLSTVDTYLRVCEQLTCIGMCMSVNSWHIPVCLWIVYIYQHVWTVDMYQHVCEQLTYISVSEQLTLTGMSVNSWHVPVCACLWTVDCLRGCVT